MPIANGARLGRYVILSPIGAGGMGEVYKAEDTLLGRHVAVKLLPDRLALNSEAAKRFAKEAKALAALSHTNILTIHDFVCDETFSFVVMELLEGETLRVRITRSPLPWQKAVEIAIGIAEGLAGAHSKGVVHRDLKPENIFLTSRGTLKILDFGLARLKPAMAEEELSHSPTMSNETKSGVVIGTIPYMSPEQIRGETVDARTDIYSFGCVLYEMLSGKRPFAGINAAETTAAILRDDPPKLSDIPPDLNRIVELCLQKDPEQRLHSAHDLAFALRNLLVVSSNYVEGIQFRPRSPRRKLLIAAVLVVVAVLFSAIGLRYRFSGGPDVPKMQSIAVLPLKNLSGDPKQDYFADGMTEEIIAKLARIRALRVISRTSVMGYKEVQKKSIRDIGKELNADAIVEGSILQAGNRIRITAQLIHASSDRNLWTDSYERDMTDVLALQNDVASAIAREIRVTLTPDERAQFAETRTVNVAAYEAFLRGINYAERAAPSKEDLQFAISMFQRAVELEPDFARAYSKLSMAHSRMYFVLYDRSRERLVEAKRAADRALKIQPDLPDAHTALGYYHYWGFRNYDQAAKEFSIATQTARNDTQALVGLAAIHKRRGDLNSALKELRKLLEFDPRNAPAAVELGIINHMIGEHAEAQRYLDLAISFAPDNSGAYEYKLDGYLKWTGNTKGGRDIIQKIPDEYKRNYNLYFIEFFERNYQTALDMLPISNRQKYENALLAGDCYRLMQKKAEAYASYDTARIELQKLIQKSPETPLFHSRIADAYAGLNRKDEAIREAKLAVQLLPVSKDAISGPARLQDLARIYALLGEQDAALDQIEYVLSIPNGIPGLSVPLLRIDPAWDPLRDHPRFQKILAREPERALR